MILMNFLQFFVTACISGHTSEKARVNLVLKSL